MLTTTIFGLNKPQPADASSGLRTAIGTNADLLEGLLDRRGYAEVLTSQAVVVTGPVDIATVGPSVPLTVPSNGMVEVFAAVDITGTGGVAANVYLIEDSTALGIILTNATASLVTTYTQPGSAGGTANRRQSGWLAFPAAAGSHTYKLQYGTAGVSGQLANRRLWVRVRTF